LLGSNPMNEDSKAGPKFSRVIVMVAAVVALLIVGAVVMSAFSEKSRHVRVLARIDAPIKTRLETLHAGSTPAEHLHGDDRTRAEVLMAIGTALFNVCYYPKNCDARKMRAIADRLEATKGAELDSGQGCLRLMADIEAACPAVHDYVWFERVREMQESGEVATLQR